ncbi:hypothetical protein TCAL_10351 [Tigriopus californicus]|uniref:Sulfhydryl oxidase n=1 Tax=Tigriopus californicus TaxID=6832 RepID=A0A553NCL4_TIGCA|nr:sulfhydryl oxidase 2-like [Tigriopus californicus]TRY63148.1 hypothetical protein TCAL_10351 [Tigriopus californicus]
MRFPALVSLPLETLIFALTLFPWSVASFGLGFPDHQALYGPEDVAITRLNFSDFASVIHNVHDNRAWMVEFYSSWCGHCIHFAPTYKTFADEVFGWRHVVGIAAIDCADDKNMPTCREYDIMGYPSMKFFPPQAPSSELGQERTGDKTVESLKTSVMEYVKKVQANATYDRATARWPDFRPFNSSDLKDLWRSGVEAPLALIVVGSKDDPLVTNVLLDFSEISSQLTQPIIVKRMTYEESPKSVLEQLGVNIKTDYPRILTVHKEDLVVSDLTPIPRDLASMVKVLKEIVLSQMKTLVPDDLEGKFFLTREETKKAVLRAFKEAQAERKNKGRQKPVVHTESEIRRRRYTVFMSDLENAILYSFNHEVAQHASITGEALNALQDYVDVLVRFFPGRQRTMKFLQAMRTWIMSHDDAVKGSDMSIQVEKLKVQFSSFDDLAPLVWIGCKGSEARFGGYPCGLWSLWHTLTVNQALADSAKGQVDEPTVVLNAMTGYVEHFFGCQECARHFLQEADNGLAFEKAVKGPNDAVLWLWKTHNRVNQRLSGDITDDSAFPKEKFPNKEHCSDCYDSQVAGYDLWSEFQLPQVVNFLKDMYGPSGLSLQSLKNLDSLDKKYVLNAQHHELAIFGQGYNRGKDESVDKANFSQVSNNGEMRFFSSIDISLCLVIYLMSATILYLVYVKFVKKRGISSHLSSLCPRSRSPTSNPLIGKV